MVSLLGPGGWSLAFGVAVHVIAPFVTNTDCLWGERLLSCTTPGVPGLSYWFLLLEEKGIKSIHFNSSWIS